MSSKMYRERKKMNDHKFLKKEAERKRIQRMNEKKTLTEEQVERRKQLARQRQARYRKRKAEQDQTMVNNEQEISVSKKQKIRTRKEHLKLKIVWKEAKEKQRAKMSWQKRTKINEKARQRYYQKKKQAQAQVIETCSSSKSTCSNKSPLSNDAIKQRAYRVRKTMPKTPEKFVDVLSHIITNATPKKKNLLEERGFSGGDKSKSGQDMNIAERIKNKMVKIKSRRDKNNMVLKRCLALMLKSTKKAKNFKFMAQQTGLSYNFVRKFCKDKSNNSENTASEMEILNRKPRKDKIAETVVEQVHDVFNESATYVPDTKAVSRKNLESKKVLDTPVETVFKRYKEKFPDAKLSQSKFHKLRPKNILTTKHKKLFQSQCEYCTNAKLKIDALNKMCEKHKVSGSKLHDITGLLEVTMCQKVESDEYHSMNCIRRECQVCGVHKLNEWYQSLVEITGSENVTWHFWTTKQFEDKKKGTKSTQKVLETSVSSVNHLIEELKKDSKDLAHHIHVANNQRKCFQTLSKKVPVDSVVMHLDYSENYSTFYQNEISSAHWRKNLITVHPIVAFYNCPDCNDTQVTPVMDVLVYISDDNKHDHHAVQNFFNETIQFLKEKRGLEFHNIYEFTDGCSAQYKSRGPLVDISYSYDDFGLKRERHYFGSCHGKGPCDAAGGVVKTATRMAVIRGDAVILNARRMSSYLESKLTRPSNIEGRCNHSRRQFFYVADIERNRPDRVIKTTLKGTRKIHAVRAISPGIIATRNLTCTCKSCLSEDGSCINGNYVKPWTVRKLNLTVCKTEKKRDSRKRATRKSTRGGREDKTNDTVASCEDPVKPSVQSSIRPASAINTWHIDSLDERQHYFKSKLEEFTRCNNYRELEIIALEIDREITDTYGQITLDPDFNVVDGHLTGDAVAKQLVDLHTSDYPDQIEGRLPVSVLADGNCLPRSGSVLAFGKEDYHAEIRCRIVVELVKHKGHYLDLTQLNKGIDLPPNEAKSLLKTYSMYSEQYVPGTRLTQSVINKVFENETMSVCPNESFCGIWQICALSSVLKCKLVSIYPDLGNPMYKLTMNRSIVPRENINGDSAGFILWTTTRQDMTFSNWVPNHFVPLLNVSKPSAVVVCNDDTVDLLDSMDSTMLDELIGDLTDIISPAADHSR